MLRAIQTIYKSFKNILKTGIVTSKIGIKQGGSSRGLLFVLYMDALAKSLRDACPNNGYLNTLHSLMLMDDTAIPETLRENVLKLFNGLIQFCKEYDMIINEDKTKLMVIRNDDRRSFNKRGVTVDHVDHYIYLGSPFSAT